MSLNGLVDKQKNFSNDENLSFNNKKIELESIKEITNHELISKTQYENENDKFSDSEDFRLKKKKKTSKSLKKYKIKKKRLNNLFPLLNQLKNCSSKKELIYHITILSDKAKEFIKFYITECFFLDLFSRNIKNKKSILSKRQLFYDMLDGPEILNEVNFHNNNIIKNFCNGCMNFISQHFYDIEYQFRKNKIETKKNKK